MNDDKLSSYLFHEGTNYKSSEYMGAHEVDGSIVFRVWAPNAEYIYLTGDFNDWNRRSHPMTRITSGGIWKICIKSDAVKPGFDKYKYCIVSGDSEHLKADPYAFYSETLKKTASIFYRTDRFIWHDDKWLVRRNKVMSARKGSNFPCPINIYELHLGSWKTRDGKTTFEGINYLNYLEIADMLIPYIKQMNYTHVELMPIMEHPYDGSWGYQVCSYYAPTSRHGSPQDFAGFIDRLHCNGIGVILDWVPAHFPKDEHGLYEFDGRPLYEYQGKDRMEHKGWGTRFFDVGRNEVQSFLISNVLFWLEVYHADGIRCDAVASMLYLDYDREPGEWIPNINGENQNIESISFFRKMNSIILEYHPDVLIIAEESTAWDSVTKPVSEGGLGFNLKWNMGWSNDIFDYVQTDPLMRDKNHNKLTFSLVYAFTQNYILPVSHDEVVHGKKSLIDKMFGSYKEKFAGMRLLLSYMTAHPGKKMIFMGCEFGQFREWDYTNQLEWFILKYPPHSLLQNFTAELNRFYLDNPQLWEIDFSWDGFQWIEPNDCFNNIIVFRRMALNKSSLIVICNFSNKTQNNYSFSVKRDGYFKVIFNSDWQHFGGDSTENLVVYKSERKKLKINIPPLTAIFLKYNKVNTGGSDDE